MIADKLKKEIYQNAIQKYGFLCLLYLIQNAEEEERYEDAGIILDVILAHSEKHNIKMPSKLSADSIADYIQGFWEMGYSGTCAIKNMPAYVEDVENEIAFVGTVKFSFTEKITKK